MTSRWFELVSLYGVLPLAFAWFVRRSNYRGAMFPLLWVLTLLCTVVLFSDPSFDRNALYRLPWRHAYVRTIVLRFVIVATALTIVSCATAPEWFLWLPAHRRKLWWLLVVGYPTVSALPQGIIWRVFFAHRYAGLFERPALLVAGGIAFGIAHITFRNRVAVMLTTIGGAIFLDTYLETESMLLATLEHGAYGILAFTLGLGRYLYLAARP